MCIFKIEQEMLRNVHLAGTSPVYNPLSLHKGFMCMFEKHKWRGWEPGKLSRREVIGCHLE